MMSTTKTKEQKASAPPEVRADAEQRLYVIPCGEGWSCLGFDVCEHRIAALTLELANLGEFLPGSPAEIGTPERYAQYQALCEIAQQRNTASGWRSQSELTPELIGLEGRRVEVRHKLPDTIATVRFQVGKSLGFIPVHLQIARRNCSGGPAVCLGEILSVRVIR